MTHTKNPALINISTIHTSRDIFAVAVNVYVLAVKVVFRELPDI